jgi:hypothetical protein
MELTASCKDLKLAFTSLDLIGAPGLNVLGTVTWPDAANAAKAPNTKATKVFNFLFIIMD